MCEVPEPEVVWQCVLHHVMSVGGAQDQMSKKPVSCFGGGSASHGRFLSVLLLFRGRYLM